MPLERKTYWATWYETNLGAAWTFHIINFETPNITVEGFGGGATLTGVYGHLLWVPASGQHGNIIPYPDSGTAADPALEFPPNADYLNGHKEYALCPRQICDLDHLTVAIYNNSGGSPSAFGHVRGQLL